MSHDPMVHDELLPLKVSPEHGPSWDDLVVLGGVYNTATRSKLPPATAEEVARFALVLRFMLDEVVDAFVRPSAHRRLLELAELRRVFLDACEANPTGDHALAMLRQWSRAAAEVEPDSEHRGPSWSTKFGESRSASWRRLGARPTTARDVPWGPLPFRYESVVRRTYRKMAEAVGAPDLDPRGAVGTVLMVQARELTRISEAIHDATWRAILDLS